MSDRTTSRGWLAVLGIAGAGVAVAGGLLLLTANRGDDGAPGAGAGPVRVRDQGARRQPGLGSDLDPERSPATSAEAAGDDGAAGPPAADGTPAGDRAGAPGSVRPPPTSNPHDLEVTGQAPGPRTGIESSTASSSTPSPSTPALVVGVPGQPGKPSPVAPGAGTGAVVLGTTSASGKPPASDPVVVDAGLPADVIRRVIRRSMAPIRACYERALQQQPTLEGTVQVGFVIGADGAVASATGTGLDATVAACVAGVVGGLRFPRPDGTGVVTVRYPFVFRPAS